MAAGGPGERFKQFLETTAGKASAVGLLLVALLMLYLMSRNNNPAAKWAAERTFICSETNKPFQADLKIGMMVPIKSPYSGKDTGYPAELCYWTADGSVRKEPFPVLLKKSVDPKAGPTFCPDCGRLVVGHNPAPADGRSAPPTEVEYNAKRRKP